MFLATTGLCEFWDRSEELLFLGSWCLRADRRREWEGIRRRILPSPWDDRARFYRAVEYLDGCYERMLGALSEQLNQAHGLRRDTRYWRILVGPWLFHYLQACYDRFIHLRQALEQHPGVSTILLAPGSRRVPADALEYVDWIVEDPYNLQLFSQILEATGPRFPTRAAPKIWEGKGFPPAPGGSGPAALARAGMGRLQSGLLRALGKRWQIALCQTDLPQSLLWKLSLRSRLTAVPMPLPVRFRSVSAVPIFDRTRQRMQELPAGDSFERCFVRMLPQNLPVLYLEGFTQAREEMLRSLPRMPPALLSGNGWYFHEPFKFLAAEAAALGSHLMAAQHGGGYGLHRSSPQERHERSVADTFLCWGWANGHDHGLRNLPAPKLSSLRRTLRGRTVQGRSGQAGEFLFIATTNPRYVYRFYSAPQGTQLEEYFEWQLRFLRALPEPLRGRLRFRAHSKDFGHGLRERFSRQVPWLRWDEDLSLARSLSQTRLAVVDHLGTPLLETLAADVPTLLFWDPQRWEVREEAQAHLDRLRGAGILMESPEEAARRLAEIEGDVAGWWDSAGVRQAREGFVRQYALGQRDWPQRWARCLEELAQGRGPVHAA